LSRNVKRALESDAQLLLRPASSWEIIAKTEKLKLSGLAAITPDEHIRRYSVEILW
jgi:PIN domain nuclease of toxin-antitoxin system